jgi:uncharacterized protein
MNQYKLNKYVFYKIDRQKCVIINLYNGAILFLTEEKEIQYFQKLLNKNHFLYDETYNDIFESLYHQSIIIKSDIKENENIINGFLNYNNCNTLHLTIFVTESCNFNCNYCFVNKNTAHTMTEETIQHIFYMIQEKVKEFAYQKISISWFGGEPLLATAKIVDFMKRMAEYCFLNNINFSSSIVTNGYLLTIKEFICLYNSGIKVIQVTFDGAKNYHDSIRQHEIYGATYEKIYMNLLSIKKLIIDDFIIIVRCNYNKQYLQNSAIDEFIIQYSKSFGHDKRFQLHINPIVDYDSWGKNKRELLTYLGNVTYLIDKAKSFDFLEENLLNLLTAKKMWCPVFNPHNLTINTRGELYTCDAVISDDRYKLAKINSDGSLTEFIRIYENELNKQLSQNCIDCNKLPICLGTCYLIKSHYNHNACFCSDNEINKLLEYLLESKGYM